MSEAALILRRFGERLKQIHISEVSSLSRHEAISFTAMNSFRKVAQLIRQDVAIILEAVVPPDQIEAQLILAKEALSIAGQAGLSSHNSNGATLAANPTKAIMPAKS